MTSDFTRKSASKIHKKCIPLAVHEIFQAVSSSNKILMRFTHLRHYYYHELF